MRSGISFHKTSPFSKHEPYYSKVSSEQLCIPSRDTRDIIAAAGWALDKIWKDGHNYAKAGVMLNDFRPCGVTQLSLFDEGRSYANSDALMNVLDQAKAKYGLPVVASHRRGQ
ncbi:unnamed protein product [Klebsiella pneumoniae subsp. rhinoscleromatis SB3432]|nr:unnamed protein product [Klebsiella pneumoniae subsp. rhinoscleromatis SB3432]CDO11674.1 unnamed protein product [Klebsiella pneumoniae]